MAGTQYDGRWGIVNGGNPGGDHVYQHSVDVDVGGRATLLDLTLMAGGTRAEALRQHHHDMQQKAGGPVLSDFVIPGLHGVPLSAVSAAQSRGGSVRRVYGGIEVQQALMHQDDTLHNPNKGCLYQSEEVNLTLPGGQLNVGPHLPLLDGRFKYIESLSEGGSAKVFTAMDMLHPQQRSVVVKAMHRHYREVGLQEQQLLRFLNSLDPEDSCHIVRLISGFDFQGHTCLVMEKLHCSLLEHMCSAQRQAMEVSERVEEIRHMALHLVVALATIHSAGVIHGDLKPENVLLQAECPKRYGKGRSATLSQTFSVRGSCGCMASSDYEQGGGNHPKGSGCDGVPVGVKLADFGNSFTSEQIKGLCRDFNVQTLAYRSPEVLLGVVFDASIDIWSLGCILAELALGRLLFACESPAQLLQQMTAMLGLPPPASLFGPGKFFRKLFQEAGLGVSDAHHSPLRNGGSRTQFCCPGQSYLGDALLKIDPLLADLVCGMLQYNPSSRLTAREALMHPFFGPIFPFRALFGETPKVRTFVFGEEEENPQPNHSGCVDWEHVRASSRQHLYEDEQQQQQQQQQHQQGPYGAFSQDVGRSQESQLATPKVLLQALGSGTDRMAQAHRVPVAHAPERPHERSGVGAQDAFGVQHYQQQEHMEIRVGDQGGGQNGWQLHPQQDLQAHGEQGHQSQEQSCLQQQHPQQQQRGEQILQQLHDHHSQLQGLLEQTLHQQQHQQLLQHCQEQQQVTQFRQAEYLQEREQERQVVKQQRLNGGSSHSRKRGLGNKSAEAPEATWTGSFPQNPHDQAQAQHLHQLRMQEAEQQLQYIQLQQHKQREQHDQGAYGWGTMNSNGGMVPSTPGPAPRSSRTQGGAPDEPHGVVPGMGVAQNQWEGVLTEESFQPVAVQGGGNIHCVSQGQPGSAAVLRAYLVSPQAAHVTQAPATPYRVSEGRTHNVQCCTIDMQPAQLEHALLGASQLQQQLKQQQEDVRGGEHLVQLQHLSWAVQQATSLQASRNVPQQTLGMQVLPTDAGVAPAYDRSSWVPQSGQKDSTEGMLGGHVQGQGMLVSCHGELQGFQQNVWYSQTPVL